MPREVTIRFSRWKNFTLSGLSAAVVIAVLIRMGWNHLHSSVQPSNLGVLIVLSMFAAASVLFLKQALNRSPQLIIFRGGVSIQRGKVIYVPWDKVRSCRSVSFKGYKALSILLYGEFHVPYSTPLLLRSLWALEKRLVGPSVGFQTSYYDMAHSKIRASIEEWIAYDQRQHRSREVGI